VSDALNNVHDISDHWLPTELNVQIFFTATSGGEDFLPPNGGSDKTGQPVITEFEEKGCKIGDNVRGLALSDSRGTPLDQLRV